MSVVCYNSELVIRAVSCLADNAEAGSAAQSLLLVADSDGFQCNVYTGSHHHHSTAPPVELPH